jgi:hypothetical protein
MRKYLRTGREPPAFADQRKGARRAAEDSALGMRLPCCRQSHRSRRPRPHSGHAVVRLRGHARVTKHECPAYRRCRGSRGAPIAPARDVICSSAGRTSRAALGIQHHIHFERLRSLRAGLAFRGPRTHLTCKAALDDASPNTSDTKARAARTGPRHIYETKHD